MILSAVIDLRMARRNDINRAPVDRFTAVHVAAGAGARTLNIPLPLVMLAAVGWEIAETPLKKRFPGRFPSPSLDSAVNTSWDITAAVLGYAGAEAMGAGTKKNL